MQDNEAYIFALCLLMPKDLFIIEVEKLKPFDFCDNSKLKQLAKTFEVTELMITARMQMLNYL